MLIDFLNFDVHQIFLHQCLLTLVVIATKHRQLSIARPLVSIMWPAGLIHLPLTGWPTPC